VTLEDLEGLNNFGDPDCLSRPFSVYVAGGTDRRRRRQLALLDKVPEGERKN
jgi:hypothetical protein